MIRYRMLLVTTALVVAGTSVAGAQEQPPTRLPAAPVVGAAKSVTVQNDRASAVTLYLEAGRIDRVIGTVAAGAVATLELPSWAVQGQRTARLVARAQGEQLVAAEYTLPLTESRPLGLLVPPRGGLPLNDRVLLTLPSGAAAQATVTVNNARTVSVTVFAEQGLLFVPIGEVAAQSQGTLTIPESLARRNAAIRVFTRSGVKDVATEKLTLKQGEHISVIVM